MLHLVVGELYFDIAVLEYYAFCAIDVCYFTYVASSQVRKTTCIQALPIHHHCRSDIAHFHMRIFKLVRVGQSARILPMHVKEGFNKFKTSFFHFRKRQQLGHEKSGK